MDGSVADAAQGPRCPTPEADPGPVAGDRASRVASSDVPHSGLSCERPKMAPDATAPAVSARVRVPRRADVYGAAVQSPQGARAGRWAWTATILQGTDTVILRRSPNSPRRADRRWRPAAFRRPSAANPDGSRWGVGGSGPARSPEYVEGRGVEAVADFEGAVARVEQHAGAEGIGGGGVECGGAEALSQAAVTSITSPHPTASRASCNSPMRDRRSGSVNLRTADREAPSLPARSDSVMSCERMAE